MTNLEKIKNFLQITKPAKEKRAKKFAQNIPFVLDGAQWEKSEIVDRIDDPTITFNFCEDYVEKYLSRLFPRSNRTGVMDVGVKIYENDQTLREKYEDEILGAYRRANMPGILLEQGTDYLIGGVACFYYPQDPITKKVKIISIDPASVYISFSDGRIDAFAYEETTENGTRITYCDTNIIGIMENQELKKELVNNSGIIPISWIPNFPHPHNRGRVRSKIDSLRDLDREYNKTMSDYSVRIEENTRPPLFIFSNRTRIEDVQRGRGKKTLLEIDGDAKYLELKEGREILDYATAVDTRMKRKTGIVDMAGSIKSALSGVSFSFQYSDMLDHIGFMRIFWDQAFRDLNRAILTYAFGPEKGNSYSTDPVYNQSFQLDELSRVEQYQKMLEMGVISRRDVIEELRGAENADEKLAEIDKENKKQKLDES